MQWTPVSSSNIAAVAYDREMSELQVRFTNGSTYKYAGVPDGVAEEIASAPSPGQYFHNNVKDVYAASRV